MKRLRSRYGCPVELALDVLGGKWKTVILAWLKEEPHRYGELRARMPDIADKVLTQRLRDLEELGLVQRAARSEEKTATYYELTARGESLRPVLDALYRWGEGAARELPVRIGS